MSGKAAALEALLTAVDVTCRKNSSPVAPPLHFLFHNYKPTDEANTFVFPTQ